MFACNGILFNHELPRRGEAFVTSWYVPEHRKMLEERCSMWFDIGLLRHLAFKAKKENWTGIEGMWRGITKRRADASVRCGLPI